MTSTTNFSGTSANASTSTIMPSQSPPNILENYTFPTHRLTRRQRHPSRDPIVLVACGSFSPVTYLHLRMFEMATDYVRQSTNFEIVGGYLSPVSDQYRKPGLLSAVHRIHMCTLATERTSSWLMVDTWEAVQSYQRTAVVLDHFDHEINDVLGGVEVPNDDDDDDDDDVTDSAVASGTTSTAGLKRTRRRVRVMLLAGSDLLGTMSEPGVWSMKDLDHILSSYGCFIIERTGPSSKFPSPSPSSSSSTDSPLLKFQPNIYLISQMIQNDVSSTKVRLFVRRGMSVRYLLPVEVVRYIEANGLYLEEGRERERERERGVERGGVESKGDGESKSER